VRREVGSFTVSTVGACYRKYRGTSRARRYEQHRGTGLEQVHDDRRSLYEQGRDYGLQAI
jgi:hypothetical protein